MAHGGLRRRRATGLDVLAGIRFNRAPRPSLARRFYEAFRGYSAVRKEELSEQKALDELKLGGKRLEVGLQ